MKERLQAYGVAGIVAYGLLNTIYYTAMFTYMWTVVYKVPRGVYGLSTSFVSWSGRLDGENSHGKS